MKVLWNCFVPDKWYFGQKKILLLAENYKRYGESLQCGTDINCIKRGKIKKYFKKLVYIGIDNVLD